jgi:hypothetical protein
MRILFERAPEETLPFLVYCIYIGVIGLISFYYLINKFDGNQLYILMGVLCFILFLPMLILPKIHLKKFFSWIWEFEKLKTE